MLCCCVANLRGFALFEKSTGQVQFERGFHHFHRHWFQSQGYVILGLLDKVFHIDISWCQRLLTAFWLLTSSNNRDWAQEVKVIFKISTRSYSVECMIETHKVNTFKCQQQFDWYPLHCTLKTWYRKTTNNNNPWCSTARPKMLFSTRSHGYEDANTALEYVQIPMSP